MDHNEIHCLSFQQESSLDAIRIYKHQYQIENYNVTNKITTLRNQTSQQH